MPELTVDLRAPGMTPLHRAGVAGLFMSLRALEACGKSPKTLTRWTTNGYSVSLAWEGSATEFMDSLARVSFGIDPKSGMIDVAAVDQSKATLSSRWIIHEGMLGTFCQFGPNNGLGEARVIVLDADGETPVHFTYRPIDSSVSARGCHYPHHDKGGLEIGHAIDEKRAVKLVGWLYPGAQVRHDAYKSETALDEDPSRALALLFAPAGCFYFKIQSRRQERKARYALLVPMIDDLEIYSRARTAMTTDVRVGDLISTSAGDAALRLLMRLRAQDIADKARLPRVIVYLLGTVVWNDKQKSRTGVMDVEVRSERALRLFERFRAEPGLQPRQGMRKDGSSYVLLPASLELFADNIARGRPFYEGFVSLSINKEIRDWLRADQKGLWNVVSEAKTFDEGYEQIFVKACHEALRRCYGIVGDRARKDHVEAAPRFKKEYERWRNAFARAKSAETFREAISDFWSRGGSNPVLRSAWRDVMPLLATTRWKQGRDLALLALCSYSSPEIDPALDRDTDEEESEA